MISFMGHDALLFASANLSSILIERAEHIHIYCVRNFWFSFMWSLVKCRCSCFHAVMSRLQYHQHATRAITWVQNMNSIFFINLSFKFSYPIPLRFPPWEHGRSLAGWHASTTFPSVVDHSKSNLTIRRHRRKHYRVDRFFQRMSTFRQPSMFCWICSRFNRFEWTSTFCLVCKSFKSAAASSNFSGSMEGYLSWTSTSGSSLWDTFLHDRSYGFPKARRRPTGWSESL